MEKRKKINIGLDIGIASVGWAVLDGDLKIINHGVRLFDTVDDKKDGKLKNETRREKRSARRLIRRRYVRRRDFVKALIDHNLINENWDVRNDDLVKKFTEKYINSPIISKDDLVKKYNDPSFPEILYLRKKGLTSKLSQNELFKVIYYYVKKRGFFYEVISEKEGETAGLTEDEKKDINNKLEQLKNKEKATNIEDLLPIDVQILYYQEFGNYVGSLNKTFHHDRLKNELQMILDNQNLSKPFLERLIGEDETSIINRQRTFEKGPGHEKQPKHLLTPYGWRYIDENGKLDEYDSLWVKTTGRCSIFPDQFRAPKKSFTSEVFNLLNDLNNISANFEVNGKKEQKKLSYEQKVEIIKNAFKTKDHTNSSTKLIAKLLSVEIDDLSGFRIDKKNKKLLTPFEAYKFFEKILKDSNKLDLINWSKLFDKDQIKEDNIIDTFANDIFSKTQIKDEREEKIKNSKFASSLDEKTISKLSNATGFAKTHALSFKGMRHLIPDLLNTNKNQMQIIEEKELRKDNRSSSFVDLKTGQIKTNWIDEKIITPTVKRALRQTILVLNSIFKLYKDYQIDDIVIEMAREHNNKQQRESETQLQKAREIMNSSIKTKIESIGNESVAKKAFFKIWLYEQQMGHDAYTGEKLDWNQVIDNPSYTEIDHIIPYEQCFMDGRTNKVLTLSNHNHDKGKRTPYQYLDDQKFKAMQEMWNKWYLNNDNKVFNDKNKFKYIMTQIDYSDSENAVGFIQRNLNDTRYATREIVSVLRELKKVENPLMDGMKLPKATNGRMTSLLRKKVDTRHPEYQLKRPEGMEDGSFDEKTGKKERIWHGHHAEDAVFVVYLAKRYAKEFKLFEKATSSEENKGEIRIPNNIKGVKILDLANVVRKELNQNMDNMKFSRRMNKRSNVGLFNETIYAGRKVGNQIEQIKKLNIIESDKKTLDKYFGEKAEEKAKLAICQDQGNQWIYDELNLLYKRLISESEVTNSETGEVKKANKFPFKDALNGRNFVEVSKTTKKGKMITKEIEILKIYSGTKKEINNISIVKNTETSFQDSFNWSSIHVYKDKKGKYRVIPIDARVATYENEEIKINWEKINKVKKENNIDIESPPFVELSYGSFLRNPETHEIFYVCGIKFTRNRIELKYLQKGNEKRLTISTNKLLNWDLININVLGNVYI